MPRKPLLLPGAKSGVLVPVGQEPSARLRLAAVVVGALVVLVGAADVTSRVAHSVFGDSAAFVAFAPAAAIINPSLLDAFSGSTKSDTPAATSTALTPTRVRVPSIGVDAKVENVGKKQDGSMGTPSVFGDVARYSLGAKPGEAGNAVFAGHVNNALTTAGVFEHLSQVNIGDTVEVSDAQGRILTFAVVEINEYQTNDAPLQEIFTTDGPSQIVLVTCDGVWSTKEHAFDKRLVVVARLIH